MSKQNNKWNDFFPDSDDNTDNMQDNFADSGNWQEYDLGTEQDSLISNTNRYNFSNNINNARPDGRYVNDKELDEIDMDEGREMRDYHPVRFRRDGRMGCLGGIMYALFVISVSVILACVGWMCASDVLALNKPEAIATVTIPKDIFTTKTTEDNKKVDSVDIDYVASQLKDAGIIEYKLLFKLYSKVSNADIKIDAGTYELSTQYDYRAIVKKMHIGSDSQVKTTLTFPEGYSMEQIFTKLEENDICSKEDLYEAAANYTYKYSFLEGKETGDASRLEGYLFPDTYEFYQGMQASSAINKFLVNFYNKFLADMYVQAENLGLTVDEVITVASMIEKEAANDEERPIIASVIYNRIKAGMPLQIDATVQYALPERKATLTEEDLKIDSPYNTYLYSGLPIGPIANPGIASINAALKPSTTKYYYYALDTATGTHKFFTNFDEHNAFTQTQNYG